MRSDSPSAGGFGHTLPEILIVLTLVGTLSALTVAGFRGLQDATAMRAAGWVVRNQLSLARSLALGRRESIRVTMVSGYGLAILDGAGRRLGGVTTGPGGDLQVDSVQVRPATLRFNSLGMAAPGSVYLHGRGRIVRIVCNFLGRLRVEVHRTP